MEEESSRPPQTTPIIEVRPAGNGRTALWILISVVVGFMLPVCSCAIIIFATFTSASFLDGASTTSSGVGDAVAIVEVKGTITSGDSDEIASGAISGIVMEDLRTAEADPTVKAIVLLVDSPGGTVTGSAQIYETVLEIEKPVVVSMESVAASGGYYVSAPADYIFARADTVTGSLGVIMTLFNAEELLDEIGVDVITITSGPNKSLGSSWEELTPEHRDILEEFIDESYDEFVRIVADGRSMSQSAVRELADGRIFTGRQAVDNGLVDELGNRQDAIDKAADLGGITGKPRIVHYEHIPSLYRLLLSTSSRFNQSEADRILETFTELTTPSLEYRYVGPGSN